MNAHELFIGSMGFIFGACFMAVGALWAHDRTKSNNFYTAPECFDYEVPAPTKGCTAETMVDAINGHVMCLSSTTLKGTL